MRLIDLAVTVLRDLRDALRALLARPGYLLACTLTLGLGLGANLAILSLLNGVLLNPWPTPNLDRIVQVWTANQHRSGDAGLSVRDAVLEAASTRLRPILMTSIATVAGAMPLVLASGPGSASRATIGVVVVFGVTLSTFLSLFVVPAFYLWLAPYTRSPEEKTRELEKLEHDAPPVEA